MLKLMTESTIGRTYRPINADLPTSGITEIEPMIGEIDFIAIYDYAGDMLSLTIVRVVPLREAAAHSGADFVVGMWRNADRNGWEVSSDFPFTFSLDTNGLVDNGHFQISDKVLTTLPVQSDVMPFERTSIMLVRNEAGEWEGEIDRIWAE